MKDSRLPKRSCVTFELRLAQISKLVFPSCLHINPDLRYKTNFVFSSLSNWGLFICDFTCSWKDTDHTTDDWVCVRQMGDITVISVRNANAPWHERDRGRWGVGDRLWEPACSAVKYFFIKQIINCQLSLSHFHTNTHTRPYSHTTNHLFYCMSCWGLRPEPSSISM